MSYRPALSLTGFALLCAALLSPAVQAQEAEAFGYFGPPAGPPQQPAATLSKLHGVMVPAQLVPLMLEKMDNHQLATVAENEPHEGKPLKIGVGRPVAFDAAMGSWFDSADGGRLWVMELSSPGAVGMRVQFTGLNLPAGAQLVVYAATDRAQISGPYEGDGEFGTGEQYTPALFDDRVRIEYYAPKGGDGGPLPFDIPSVQHIFRDPIKSGFGDITSAEGTCHYDVTCYSAWANVAKAVGRFSFVESGNTYLCTGQLIAKSVPDSTPYFITARHCVSTATVAATVDVYWLYQTASCNGAAPSLGSLSHTTGATVKATRLTSDGSLLQLTGALPGGLYWVGWRSAAVTSGSAGACVHHPDGAYKRISWATMTDNTGPTIAGETEVVRADWVAMSPATNIGVTEGGSSGSGLFTNDVNQQLVGTLSGGPSACGASAGNLNDGYGRFASFYPDIATFLTAAASDDGLEENDSCAAARVIAVVVGMPAVNNSLTVKSTDEDWYSFSVPAGHTLTVALSFTHANGNVDEALYTTCGGSIIASSTTATNAESMAYTNSGGSAVTARVRVYLASGTTNTYNMTATLTAPAPTNDACSGATTVASGGTYNGTTSGMTIDGANNCDGTVRPDAWYKFTAASALRLSVDTCTTTAPNDTVISLHSACPGTGANQVACNDDAAVGVGPCGAGGNTTSFVQTDLTAGQTVYIRVAMYYAIGGTVNGGTTTGAFVLHVNTLSLGVPNDTCATPTAISTGATAFDNTNAVTDGPSETACDFFSFDSIARDLWYAFTTPSHGDLTVDTCGSSFDTKLAIYDSCPSAGDHPLSCDDDASPACAQSGVNSRVSATGLAAGNTLYIRVGGYRTTGGVDRFGAGTLNVTFTSTPSPCVPDMGQQGGLPGADGNLDNNDFVVFITFFFDSNPIADIGVQGGTSGSDGLWDNNDFVVFIEDFFNGCP